MNNKTSLVEKLLAKIEHARPLSRQYFIVRNVGVWFLALLSICVGGFAIASLIFRLVNAQMALGPGIPPVSNVILAIPFLWIILVAAFVYVAYREIRLTQKGYKYELSVVVLSVLFVSCVLGISLYVAGVGFTLDRFASEHVPLHPDLEKLQRERWMNPEAGFLVGVVQQAEESSVSLLDPMHTKWKITFTSSISDEKVANLAEGERVGVRGKILSAEEHTFLACDIRSLEFEGRGILPPPRNSFEKNERKVSRERSNECEDVRPLDY